MVTQPAQTTTWATIVTQFFKEQLSTFASSPESILGSVSTLPLEYGKSTGSRKIQDPDTIVAQGREFNPNRGMKVTEVQQLDFINLSDGLQIPRADFAADPEGARIHVQDTGTIFRNSIEKTFIAGASSRTLCYGVEDYPSGTGGTINRPEMCYVNATSGDWATIANIRTDLIESIAGMIQKRFYGPKLMLVPSLVRPMFSQLIAQAGTSGPQASTANYIVNTLGLPIAYSPFVHEAATKDDFNIFIIDTSKVHLGISPAMFDAYYVNKDHAYYWDWEVYMTPLFDPLYDGTEYLKGVARLDARDWND